MDDLDLGLCCACGEKRPFKHRMELHPEAFPANNPMAAVYWFGVGVPLKKGFRFGHLMRSRIRKCVFTLIARQRQAFLAKWLGVNDE